MNVRDDEIREILGYKNIAVVGLSKNPQKASHIVARYLKLKGYNIIPVNPTAQEILGKKAYKNLSEVPEAIDIVDVFRPREEALEIAKEALKVGAKVLWLQLGISSKEAYDYGRKNGLKVVMDKCIKIEHERLKL